MSVQATGWAFAQDVVDPDGKSNSGAKFVLVALANYADEDGSCFPSERRLADDTGQAVRTVRRHLAFLEESELIESEERRRQDGTRTSNRYQLLLPKVKRARSAQAAKLAAGSNGGSTGHLEQDNRPKTADQAANLAGQGTVSNKEPSEEPSPLPEALANASGRGPRVEKRGEGVEKPERPSASNLSPSAKGMLMTRWRAVHYAPDGKPPAGYSDGRDVEVLQLLVDYCGFGVQEIADAIDGIAMMRRDGHIHGIRTGEKLTARFLQGDRDGRPMVRVAAEYFHASRKRVAPGPAGFMTAGVALRSLVGAEPP